MAFTWKKVIAPLALAFALTGCENAADIAAKPQIVQQMVENSASICQPAAQGNAAAYAARLNDALSAATTADLRTLKENNITVCLDQRLDNQNAGFWDTRAQGVLSENADGKGGVATIWDNGRQPEDGGLFHRIASYDSGYIIHAFATHLRGGDVKPGERWIAYDTSVSTSDGGYIQDSSAKPESKFDKDTLAKNPWLKTLPVKAAPQGPSAPGS